MLILLLLSIITVYLLLRGSNSIYMIICLCLLEVFGEDGICEHVYLVVRVLLDLL